MNYRNRELLDLAYRLPCQVRLEGICVGGFGEPSHSNQYRHGKGGSIKAHDCFFASACRACHRELDQGTTLTREKKFHLWDQAYLHTMLELWKAGHITVNTAPLR